MAGTTRITLVGVLMAVLVAVGCAPPPEQHPDPVIIGDSIMVSLQQRFGGWFGPTQLVDAAIGRAIPSGGLDAVKRAVPHTWAGDKFVIELGTNDVGWHPNDRAWYTAQIQSVLDAIPQDRCVAWVLPYRIDTWVMNESTRLWNYLVATMIWQRRCFALIDWYSVADANPGFLLPDGIHLNSLGNEELAHEIADALANMVLPPVLIPPETAVPTT
jgi:lysophospholipase L1-like esterase